MPPSFHRWLRKWLIRYAKTLDQDKLIARACARAARVAAEAARVSPAYQTLLREHGIAPERVASLPLTALPRLDKASTFGRFSLTELARPVPTSEIADVLTSSGRGGSSFGYKLTLRPQYESSWFDIDLGLQDMFDIDGLPTLVVNCLPMGVIFRSKATAIANLSVREDMACSILRDIGPRFRQTLLCTDPVFIRCLLDEGRRAGVDWRQLNTSAIMGEEVMVEAQRDYFARAMDIDLDAPGHRTIGSTYGMGELGLNLLFESRDTIRIRRHLWRRQGPLASSRLAERDTFGLFCFNPLRCHPEILEPDAQGYGELVLTLLDTRATIPLPRYSTGDIARLIPAEEAKAMAQAAAATPPWLPMIALKGRIKDRPTGQASVESVKEWLYTDHALANRLTGAFRLSAQPQADQFRLVVQAHPGNGQPLDELKSTLLRLLHKADQTAIQLELVPAEQFEWRPVLDFERKFAYRAS